MTHYPVTDNLVEAMRNSEWPRPAAICDFGLDSQAHYEAIYFGVVNGSITVAMLDAVLGDGPAITKMVRANQHNPHKDITFETAYDGFGEEE